MHRYYTPILLLSAFLLGILASDDPLLFCVITAKRPTSYLPELIHGLEDAGANFDIVDVDNSTPASMMDVLSIPTTFECRTDGIISCPEQKRIWYILEGLARCIQDQNPQWVALTEDNLAVCDGGVETMHTVLESLGLFKLARFTKYSRVVVFPIEFIQTFSDYARKLLHMVSYDILLSFNWAEGRDYVHPTALFAYRGDIMTTMDKTSVIYMNAYNLMRQETCGASLVDPNMPDRRNYINT